MDILKEMDEFLETYNLWRLNQEEMRTTNRQINTNKIKSVIKIFSTHKIHDQKASQVNSTKHLKNG